MHGTEASVKFATDPSKWPVWPQLPLKRVRNGILECGRLIEEPGSFKIPVIRPIVYLGTIFEKVPYLDTEQQIEYQDLWAVFDDDWRID